jgi:hypothetical protein
MDPRDRIIALLVHQLGSDVTISVADIEDLDVECVMEQDPHSFASRLQARRPPATIEGELIRSELHAAEGATT